MNNFFSLLATCAILISTPTFAMEMEEPQSAPLPKPVLTQDGFLTAEQIEAYNTGLLAPYGAKILYSFNPETVENIVVGCDIIMHSTHFFGGSYQNSNNYIGFIVRGEAHSLVDPQLRNIPPMLMKRIDKDRLSCSYHFHSYKQKEYGQVKEVKRDFHTKNHSEALQYALSRESGNCRFDEEENLWEVNPEKSIYINSGLSSENHIQGDFEKITSLPFLGNVKKIIIEYCSQRTTHELKTLIQNAHTILAPGGMLLLEHGPTGVIQMKPSDIVQLSLPDFQLKRIFNTFEDETKQIPCRGQCNDGVYSFQAIKK